jgi:pyridinium-3,5-biscarboxylic acid mononucleotide synthase
VDLHRLRRLLEQVAAGGMAPDAAMEELAMLPFQELDEGIRVDHHRVLRSGIPEVVLGEWKSAEQIIHILQAMAERGHGALATRVNADKAAAIIDAVPGAVHHERARTVVVPPDPDRARPEPGGVVAVVAAGTSDLPVAEEASVTLSFLGHEVVRIFDVGVAGVHRLLAELGRLRAVDVIIVAAGMEGALPSVVAGLVARPVVAVPTSVGYGAGAGGFAALLGMLSSCSPGVTVVNIDNGFGAAAAAARILGLLGDARHAGDRADREAP